MVQGHVGKHHLDPRTDVSESVYVGVHNFFDRRRNLLIKDTNGRFTMIDFHDNAFQSEDVAEVLTEDVSIDNEIAINILTTSYDTADSEDSALGSPVVARRIYSHRSLRRSSSIL